MAKQLYDRTVTETSNGVYLDGNPLDQPKGTRRFTLNAVEESFDGQENKVSNEPSNAPCTSFPAGYYPIGDCYTEDDTSFVILVNPVSDMVNFGLVTRDNVYTSLADTGALGHKITHQCDIKYRLRRGNERVFYWVDGRGLAKTVNIDRLYDFYNPEYKAWLSNPIDSPPPEKWDSNSFNLIKTFSLRPTFESVQVVDNGSVPPGSYNFAVQLVDEDLNPTAWITTSNPVRIYNDTSSSSYERIRGSRNVNTDSQSFPRASKSIRLTIGNLDPSFPYYRVAVIRAAGNTGNVDKVLAGDLLPTSESVFTYSGNDGNLTEVALEDILIENEAIFAPKHIEQFENTLILANMKGKDINWCEFQAFASKIKADLVTKSVILNTVESDPNVKAAKSTFQFRGYMPGEVHAFAICYVFPDFVSPAFHIPGKSPDDTETKMKVYEGSGRYLDIHNCSTDDYWGRDYLGDTLVGKPVRHHRFPFRQDIINGQPFSKPLVQHSSVHTDINRYKLTVKITLNPSYTPTPPGTPPYPEDSEGRPLTISYRFNFRMTGTASDSGFSSILTDTDTTRPTTTTLYDDSISLDAAFGGQYAQLDPDSELADYMGGGNDRFIITLAYAPYVATSIAARDDSEIFGIEFSNIERPHPDCIGFYICRAERNEDDRLILDTAIFGPMIENQQYKSFGLIMPKQFYTTTGCSSGRNSPKALSYFKRGTWFFNPEFQYFNKKLEFSGVKLEGTYDELNTNLPTISTSDNSACNDGGTRGVYINDVQAGTSYNPDVNKKKDKDDDGFDLVIGYRNTDTVYTPFTSPQVFPGKDRITYLNAASYQNYNFNTYYNVSVDNKIGMFLTAGDLDTSRFYNPTTKRNSLAYGALTRELTSSYSNFTERVYYKEHNNVIPFTNNATLVNGVEIYNGDAEIGAFNFVSSTFYEMVLGSFDKKSRVWKIIVGVALVAGAVIATAFTGGLAAPLAIVAASSLAISFGVSLAVSGIKFEQMKSMMETDYPKGLKETVTDGGVYECLDDVNLGGEDKDDTIRWFADRVSNIYMESAVPFGLRSGLTAGVVDFTDSPAPYNEEGFRSYLTEKLTTLDREQGSGRLYRGFASSEVYDMNPDYMRFNKEKVFFHLPVSYDCCSDNKETFPTRWRWSQQSFQEEKTDNFAVFLPNNYRDIEGEHGEITDLYRLGNNLFIQTKECLWQVPKNNQERVTGEIVSFIGTGELFSIPPVKILDDTLGSGGTAHKWATVKTKFGVISVSEMQRRINLHGQGLQNIAEIGIGSFFEENMRSFLPRQLSSSFGVTFPLSNNPANPNGTGYLSAYDTRWERIIITKRDYLILPDKLALLEMSPERPLSGDKFMYDTSTGLFYQGITPVSLDDPTYFENKSFTVSYSFRGNRSRWTSWHSYIPNYYIHSQNNLYAFLSGDVSNRLWKYNQKGSYQKFFDKQYPFIIEGVALSSQLQDKIFEDMTLHSQARLWDKDRGEYTEARHITFNKLLIYTSTQCSGELELLVKETQDNPEDWLFQQVVNTPGIILASRRVNDWHINGFRDYLTDNSAPIFTREWSDIKDNFYIDKVVNIPVINHDKIWNEQRSFKDKYIVFRLKFDNFDNVNLIVNYSVTTENVSP